jgi:hypothetical protein
MEGVEPVTNTSMKKRGSDGRRMGWAIAAYLLALTGMVVEKKMHLLSGDSFLRHADPYADPATTAAYGIAASLLIVNEYALRRRWRHVAWLRPAALIGTWAALPLVLLTVAVFLPLLPLSLPLIACYGLGLLAWMPLLVLAVYIAQLRALRAAGRASRRPVPRVVIAAAALSFVGTTAWLLGRILLGA